MEVYTAQFVVFLLMLGRITSMLATVPVLGHQAIPPQVKIALGIFLSFVLFPMQSSMAASIDIKIIGMVVLLHQEVIIGMMMGFAVGLIFAGIRYAGELIGFDMGYTIASTFDPETSTSVPIIGEMLYSFMAMIFLLLNGHHFVLQALQLSYRTVPIGHLTLTAAASQKLVAMTGSMFIVAVKFAAPAIVSLFLTNIALAILTRLMPQMNIFGVAFPLKIGVGLIVLSASIPVMVYVFKKLLLTFETNLVELIKVL
jgi:flagellar biosynthetic protein FliR